MIPLDGSLLSLIPSSLKRVFCSGCRGSAKQFKGVIAIDGKTLRRSHDQAAGKKALHLVSAWAVENRLVLAQLATEEKSNEITAIPVLLRQLALTGCIVTIDAMGTQTKIAAQIIEQEGDYALALKDNQGNLYEEVKATFALAEKDGFARICNGSRIAASRRGMVGWKSGSIGPSVIPTILAYLDPEKKWKGLRGIGMVRAERRMEQEISAGNPLLSCSVSPR